MTTATEREWYALSASRIDAFDACPWYFFNEYILPKERNYRGDYDPSKPLNLRIGQFCHSVAEQYTKALIETNQEADFERFKAVFDGEWAKEHYISVNEYEDIHGMLYRWAEKYTAPLRNIYAAELELALTWDLKQCQWFDEATWMRMKLDEVCIDGSTAYVTDYKTSYSIPPEGELKKALQTKIYPWGLSVLNPYLQEFVVTYNYLRWGVTRQIALSASDLVYIEDRLRMMSRKIAAKIADAEGKEPKAAWPATVGDRCAICRYHCTLIDQGAEIIRDQETARTVGMAIQVMEKQRKALTEALKAYANQAGPVEIPTGTYSFGRSETVKLRPSKVVDYCLDRGIDIDLYLKTDTDKIKKLPEGDEVRDALMGMATVTATTRFKFEGGNGSERGE